MPCCAVGACGLSGSSSPSGSPTATRSSLARHSPRARFGRAAALRTSCPSRRPEPLAWSTRRAARVRGATTVRAASRALSVHSIRVVFFFRCLSMASIAHTHSRVLALIEKHRGTVPTRSEPSRADTRTPSMADARSREFRLSQVLDKVRSPATHSFIVGCRHSRRRAMAAPHRHR